MAQQSSRVRDIFPLPSLKLASDKVSCSRAVRRRADRKLRTVSWCNQSISCLKDLAGRGSCAFPGVSDFGQRQALLHLEAAYFDFGAPPGDWKP